MQAMPDTRAPSPDQAYATLSHDRRSIRAFLPKAVPDNVLHQVLTSARQAPSGANLQPGSFWLVQGDARSRLSAALVAAFHNSQQETEDYSYFPDPMPGLLRRRQVAAARALYDAIGIGRDDRAGRDRQFERNFCFFDAPVALLVTIERSLGSGCYMDLGMALYGLMLSAQSHGLASCTIGALASYPALIRSTLGLDGSESVVCGIALGYADPDAPVNQTRTVRTGLETFFQVIDQ